MAKNRFSISEAISFGWNTTVKNLAFFVFILLILAGIAFLPSLAMEAVDSFLLLLVLLAFRWVLSIIAAIGLIYIVLELVDERKPKVKDLFSQSHLFFKYVLSSAVVGLVTFVGFLLLIVPGIIVAVRLQFYPYFIVEEGAGPIEAAQKSWDLTAGSTWHLLLFSLSLVGVQLLGALALLVGLVFAIPTVWVARAKVYRELRATETKKA